MTAGLVILVGLAGVIVERTDLVRWSDALTPSLAALDGILGQLGAFVGRLGMFDILGVIFAVAGLVFVSWRVRVRFLASERWRARACPKCGGEITRIQRRPLDRILGKLFLPHARRYYCPKCKWSGLRHRGSHKHHDPLDEKPPVQPAYRNQRQ